MSSPDEQVKGFTEAAGFFNEFYDSHMYNRLVNEYYSGSGFLNFGYWRDDTQSAAQASANLLEKLLSFLKKRDGKILDVGCGTGAATSYLLTYFRPEDVTGINISEKQLETCREDMPDCTFLRMDAVKLDFPDGSFDNVICVEAAHHFHPREAFLREAARVVKTGGQLVMSDILISDSHMGNRPHFCKQNAVSNLNSYRDEFLAAGFSDVRVVDATEQSWKPCFWNVVRFTHEKLWKREITLEEKDSFMARIYKLTTDLAYYVLVNATR